MPTNASLSSPPYVFLSPEWIAAARQLRENFGEVGPAPVEIAINMRVSEVPFTSEPLLAHVDTASGPVAIDAGHLDQADLSVEIDWETAKALLIDGNPQAVMSAFMAGKIRVEGDMTKLVALQTTTPDPRTHETLEQLRAITS